MGLYVDDEDFWGRPKEPPKTLNTIDERADYLKVELLQNWENLGGDQTLELIKELPENDWFIVLTQNGRAFPGFFPILVDDLKNGDIFISGPALRQAAIPNPQQIIKPVNLRIIIKLQLIDII